jgi:hypothetical protein
VAANWLIHADPVGPFVERPNFGIVGDERRTFFGSSEEALVYFGAEKSDFFSLYFGDPLTRFLNTLFFFSCFSHSVHLHSQTVKKCLSCFVVSSLYERRR